MSISRGNGYDLLRNGKWNLGKFIIICHFFLNSGEKLEFTTP